MSRFGTDVCRHFTPRQPHFHPLFLPYFRFLFALSCRHSFAFLLPFLVPVSSPLWFVQLQQTEYIFTINSSSITLAVHLPPYQQSQHVFACHNNACRVDGNDHRRSRRTPRPEKLPPLLFRALHLPRNEIPGIRSRSSLFYPRPRQSQAHMQIPSRAHNQASLPLPCDPGRSRIVESRPYPVGPPRLGPTGQVLGFRRRENAGTGTGTTELERGNFPRGHLVLY